MNQSINYSSTTGSYKTRSMKIAILKKGDKSTVSTARYVISQKPIVSIYNIPSISGRAWGMEWINENLPSDYYTRGNSKADFEYKAGVGLSYGDPRGGFRSDNVANRKDGLGNALKELNISANDEKTWSWNSNKIKKAATMDAEAWYACMSRNRDENGDGVITEDEVKWYLPGIAQYEHFWVGTNTVPDEVTLYPAEFRLRNKENTNANM